MQVGTSRAEDALREHLDEVLSGDVDGAAIGSELYAIAQLLDTQPPLRRALTEPAVEPAARARLATQLLETRLSAPTIAVAVAAVSQRWSRSRDLADALERCSVIAASARAEADGNLDAVEDDLFRFGRILQSNAGLRDALSDRTASVARRQVLLDGLVEGRVSDVTRQLLNQVISGRQRTFTTGLAEYQQLAASRRKGMVATVWVAAPLSDDQRDRLAASLAAQYSHEVHLNIVVDPDVLGGVRVAIGDEVIDSTIENRLARAERQIR